MKYDVIIIGSSPLSLVFAALQAQKGRRVCLVEMDANLGGAWSVDDALSLRFIETSPHVFLPKPAAYHLLDKMLDAEFDFMSHQPQLHWLTDKGLRRKAVVPISNQNLYRRTLAKAALVHADWKKPKSVLRRLSRLGSTYFSNLSKDSDVMYPSGGLFGLFQRAEIRLIQSGVSVLKSCRAVAVRIDNGLAVVQTEDDGCVSGRQLLLTRHTELGQIAGSDGALPLNYYTKSALHFVMKVKSAHPNGFLQFCGDSPLMFVNDITDYTFDASLKDSGLRLVCGRTIGNKVVSLKDAFALLKHIKYLPDEATCVDGQMGARHVKKLTEGSIKSVRRRYAPVVDFLLSDDLGLMDSIASLAENEGF